MLALEQMDGDEKQSSSLDMVCHLILGYYFQSDKLYQNEKGNKIWESYEFPLSLLCILSKAQATADGGYFNAFTCLRIQGKELLITDSF